MQLVMQPRGGELALVPVGHWGEEREGAVSEPGLVHLGWIVRRCIQLDIEVSNPLRRRANHVDRRGGDHLPREHGRPLVL